MYHRRKRAATANRLPRAVYIKLMTRPILLSRWHCRTPGSQTPFGNCGREAPFPEHSHGSRNGVSSGCVPKRGLGTRGKGWNMDQCSLRAGLVIGVFLSLAAGTAFCRDVPVPKATGAPKPQAKSLTECLVLPPVGRYGRTLVHQDALKARLLN